MAETHRPLLESRPGLCKCLRVATRLPAATAIAFGLIGLPLFVAPSWSADAFPWPVSPFLAMTMGAWYLGSAVFAANVGRRSGWADAHALLAYLWIFALGQGLVLLIHVRDLDLGEPLGVPYVLAVGTGALAALGGIVDVARRRPALRDDGPPVPRWLRILTVLFVLAVLALAAPLVDGYDSPGSIWPGPLELPSARAFAAFFTALSLGAATLVRDRSFVPVAAYLRAGIVLSSLILIAAVVYVDRFDIGEHPLQLLYIGLYVGVLALSVAALALAPARADRSQTAVPA
jgi:hypothetical protein